MTDAPAAPVEVAAEPLLDLPHTPSGPPGSWFWRLGVRSGGQVAVLKTPTWIHLAVAGVFLAAVLVLVLAAGAFQEGFRHRTVADYWPHWSSSTADQCWDYLLGHNNYPTGNPTLDELQPLARLALVALLLGIITIPPIMVGLSRRSGRIVFDRREGVVEARRHRRSRDIIVGLPIKNIAAVQLCSGLVPGQDRRGPPARCTR